MFAQNIDCGYTIELPLQGGSYEYPQSMFWIKKEEKYVYPCIHTPVWLYKGGLGGIHFTDMFS